MCLLQNTSIVGLSFSSSSAFYFLFGALKIHAQIMLDANKINSVNVTQLNYWHYFNYLHSRIFFTENNSTV